MFYSIIFALVVAFFTASFEASFVVRANAIAADAAHGKKNEGTKEFAKNFWEKIRDNGWRVAIMAILSWAAFYGGVAASKAYNAGVMDAITAASIGVVCLLLLLALMVYPPVRIFRHGERKLRRALLGSLLEIVLFIGGWYVAASVVKPLVPVLGKLPRIALITSIGWLFADYFFFLKGKADGAGKSSGWGKMAWLIKIIVIIMIVITLLQGVDLKLWKLDGLPKISATIVDTDSEAAAEEQQSDPQSESDEETAAEEQEVINANSSFYGFYNPLMLNDGDPVNDNNFGPAGVGETAEELKDEFYYRLTKDPALQAATEVADDQEFRTGFSGVSFSGDDDGDLLMCLTQIANSRKRTFMGDQEFYYRSHDALRAFLDTCTVRVAHGYAKNCAWMNPYTTDGVPDVVFSEGEEVEVEVLLFERESSKFGKGRLALIIACGYQWAKDFRESESTPPPTSITYTPQRLQPHGQPEGSPEPFTPKDISQNLSEATPNVPGDGPGEDSVPETGNQSVSAFDKPGNSGWWQSYEDYLNAQRRVVSEEGDSMYSPTTPSVDVVGGQGDQQGQNGYWGNVAPPGDG